MRRSALPRLVLILLPWLAFSCTQGQGGDFASELQVVRVDRSNLEHIRPAEVLEHEVFEGGTELSITYLAGLRECNRLTHVEVRFQPSLITVTPFIGDVRRQGPCYPVGRSYNYRFELREPVDGRPIEYG